MQSNKKAITRVELQPSIQLHYSRIPKELQDKNRWVCFKFVQKEEQAKVSKVPMNPNNGGYASCNDPKTWSNFQTALNAVEKYDFDGIGFQLGEGIFGVDLDNCFDQNCNLSDEARDILNRLDSYTEFSPSGKGLHILAFGPIPGGERKNTEKGLE